MSKISLFVLSSDTQKKDGVPVGKKLHPFQICRSGTGVFPEIVSTIPTFVLNLDKKQVKKDCVPGGKNFACVKFIPPLQSVFPEILFKISSAVPFLDKNS